MSKSLIVYFLLALAIIAGQTTLAQTNTTAPVISNVRVENIYLPGAQIKWDTDKDSDSYVMIGTASGNYSLTVSYDCYGTALTKSHCVNLTTLSANITYYYKVRSIDASGNTAYSSEYSFTTPSSGGSSGGSGGSSGSMPSAPSNLAAALASNGVDVNLTWTDNSSNESEFKIFWRVQGGSWSQLTMVGSNTTTFTYYNHPTGTYEYHINACNSYGCSGDSNTATITLSSTAGSDTTAPVISNVRATSIADTSAEIKWDSDDMSDSRVAFGTSSGYYTGGSTNRCDAGGNVASHCVLLSGLSPGTTYYYKVESRNSAGLDSQLGGFQFTTTGSYSTSSTATSFDTTAPMVITFAVGSDTSGNLRPGASFSEAVDQATLNDSNIYVIVASSGSKISGTVGKYSNGVDYLFAPASGVEYQLVVKDVKDLSGNKMSATYYSPRFTTASTTAYYSATTSYASATTTYTYATTTTYSYAQTSLITDATVKGAVTDAGGAVISGAGIHIYKEDYSQSFSAQSANDGSFSVSVSAGNYLAELYPPLGRTDLLNSSPMKFSISSGQTKILNLQFNKAVKKITGSVLFSNNQPVTNGEVGAYNEQSRQWVSAFTTVNGAYTLNVGPGQWQVGLRPRDPLSAKWRWDGPFQEVSFQNDTLVESRMVNFLVMVADSTVVARTLDQDLKPIAGAYVVLSVYNQTQTASYSNIPPEYRQTDILGFANFPVTVGRYYLRAYLPSDKGFINPEEQVVDISAGQTKEVTLIFRKVSAIATVLVSGVTKLDSGQTTDAFVWAWSEKGLAVQLRSDASGQFSFAVPAYDRVRIGSGKELNGVAYESEVQTLDIKDAAVGTELVLTKVSVTPLASPVTTTQSATQQIITQMQDGASVVIPPSAAITSGTVTVQVDPTNEAPSLGGATVVSTVYDIVVRDQSGTALTQLQSEIEITIPYSETELSANGVSEQAVVPSFFDEKNGTWVRVDNYTIDTDKNIVIARVKHLTRFALVAAADVVPPLAPTQISATALGQGRVSLGWVNPTVDFHHVKIYRSTKSGELGIIAAPEVISTSFVDSNNIINGTVYYYTVRAVDPAGNESNNTNQVSVVAQGSSGVVQPTSPLLPTGQAVKAAILRTLKQGLSGDDVKALQQLLLNEGVYPQGLITGYFGSLTKQAVIRFQEKYAAEILTPAGLTLGTGFVGVSTLKKINELLGFPPTTPFLAPTLPTGQAVKAAILRTLKQGLSGEDVKTLQQLLLEQGVYPQGLITGYFGDLTRQAVIRFQEKYTDEILAPLGLTKGTGVVGPATRKKVNEIISK